MDSKIVFIESSTSTIIYVPRYNHPFIILNNFADQIPDPQLPPTRNKYDPKLLNIIFKFYI